MCQHAQVFMLIKIFFQIATIVFSRYNRLKFDPLWLNDIYERVVADFTVEEINPLIMNPGRLLLSSSGIYFQPYNNIQPVSRKRSTSSRI